MAIDNSSYDALQESFFCIKNYLETTTLGREHSPLMLKHEALGTLLETFDVEALEEQTKEIHNLHIQLNAISDLTKKIANTLNDTSDSVSTAQSIAATLDTIFNKINNISL